jgi:hypothetical protein
MEPNIHFPIRDAYDTEEYSLVIVDGFSVTHFFNLEGVYEGFEVDPLVDEDTGINKN